MKTLMLSTAILAGLSGMAAAQDMAATEMFRTEVNPLELRATQFIGMRVYASEAGIEAADYDGIQDGWEDIGEVNDVILSRDGLVEAVLVDIGGFLGMGERQVAVSMSAISFVGDGSTMDDASDYFLVMPAARADLEAAPDYMLGDATMHTDAMTDTTADTATATDTMADPVVRDGYLAAEADFLTSEKLTGASVFDANDEQIGEIGTLVLTEDGQVSQAIVDVGGFLGIGEKPVALNLSDITILRNEAGDDVRVYLTRTREELDAMPAFEG